VEANPQRTARGTVPVCLTYGARDRQRESDGARALVGDDLVASLLDPNVATLIGAVHFDIAYALIRHRDPALPVARGTVVFNPGRHRCDRRRGGLDGTARRPAQRPRPAADDPRGTGRSHALSCGLTELPATRQGFVRAIGRCAKRLGRQARAYTSAATADDFEAVRAHLGIPRLDLYGVSYGTYLMTVFAQRHPTSVRSIVLSSAFPRRSARRGRST
jgi:pimeloyl-ACP methyl ester carboxylesterase